MNETPRWVGAHKPLTWVERLRIRFARGPVTTDWFRHHTTDWFRRELGEVEE